MMKDGLMIFVQRIGMTMNDRIEGAKNQPSSYRLGLPGHGVVHNIAAGNQILFCQLEFKMRLFQVLCKLKNGYKIC